MNLSRTQKYNYIPVLLIAALTFLPMSAAGNMLRLVIVAALAVVRLLKSQTIRKDLLIFFLAMILSVIIPCITVFLFEHSLNISLMIHEFQRMAFYILLIFVIYDYKVPFRFIYGICIFILLFNFSIQLMQYNEVPGINDFIRKYYLVSSSDIHLSLAENTGDGFRSGSIYLNPNVYMVIPSVILVVILQANMLRPNLINYVWAAAALGSLLLTGSRTTFFVAAGILAIYVFMDKNSRYMKWIIVAVPILYIMFNFSELQENFRVFDLGSGVDSSLGVKFSGFVSYLKNANPIYFLTGSLSSALHIQIDSEWGYVFCFFGILGLYWYVNFIRRLGHNKKTVPFLANGMRIVICLIAISATIVLCMPVFSFFCLVGLVEIDDV